MFNVKCEIADVGNRRRRAARTPLRQSADIINSTSHISHSSGLTLIELLISIAIIATLSALFLGASRAAMESARAARTKTTILKIHTLIMEQYASYETRRVDLDQTVVNSINTAFAGNPQVLGNAMADLRVLALRELMKFEMPDRWSDVDILLNPLNKPTSTPQQQRDCATVVLENVPTIARTYYRRYRKALENSTAAKVEDNEGAECLYLTVMLMTGDGEARTLFNAQDIGDKDEDGLPEFVDGWGNPIQFLRWAPGFVVKSSLMSGDGEADHDPFDPFRRAKVVTTPEASANPVAWPPPGQYGVLQTYVEALRGSQVPTGMPDPQVGFRLVPLIYSGGPDGAADIVTAREVIMGSWKAESSWPDSKPGYLNPYFSIFESQKDNYAMGAPLKAIYASNEDGEDNSVDNITNHLQEGR